MYESITKLLPRLMDSSFGIWHVDTEHKGTEEEPIQMPFFEYDCTVNELRKAIYDFVDDHEEMKLSKYREILETYGIEWTAESMENANVSSLDGKCVMALMVGTLRGDRFCEGIFLRFLKAGVVTRWIERLKEIDE